MDIKERPNHQRYVQILRSMTPEQKLQKAFELADFARELCLQGLRQAHPGATEQELTKLYVERITPCHNRNY